MALPARWSPTLRALRRIALLLLGTGALASRAEGQVVPAAARSSEDRTASEITCACCLLVNLGGTPGCFRSINVFEALLDAAVPDAVHRSDPDA
jgi:hypothetical protein